MLAGFGIRSFFECARQIYGESTTPLRYVPLTPLDLAQRVRDTIAQLTRVDTLSPRPHTADPMRSRRISGGP
jgi:hypothetical protein